MNATADARGLKRVCVSCGIRFYDLNKRPINCPNCSTEFSSELKLKGRRGRLVVDAEAELAKAKPIVPVANDDRTEEIEDREEGVVSLEDVAAIEDADDDVDLEDDDMAGLEEIEDEDALEVPAQDKKE